MTCWRNRDGIGVGMLYSLLDSNEPPRTIEIPSIGDSVIVECHGRAIGVVHKAGEPLEGYTMVSHSETGEEHVQRPVLGKTLVFGPLRNHYLYFQERLVLTFNATYHVDIVTHSS